MTYEKFKEELKWFSAGAVNLIPGYSWFISWAPPLFEETGIIMSAFGLAITYSIYSYKLKSNSGRFPQAISTGMLLILGSFCLIIIYIFLMDYYIVRDTQSGDERFTIGFGKQNWSLTKLGLKYKNEILPNEPVVKWMEAEALFYDDGPEKLWKSWCIILANIIMLVVFILAFILWAAGFAFLAKYKICKI